MNLTVRLEHESPRPGQPLSVRALLTLAGHPPGDRDRIPLNLALVLDRSGSTEAAHGDVRRLGGRGRYHHDHRLRPRLRRGPPARHGRRRGRSDVLHRDARAGARRLRGGAGGAAEPHRPERGGRDPDQPRRPPRRGAPLLPRHTGRRGAPARDGRPLRPGAQAPPPGAPRGGGPGERDGDYEGAAQVLHETVGTLRDAGLDDERLEEEAADLEQLSLGVRETGWDAADLKYMSQRTYDASRGRESSYRRISRTKKGSGEDG